MSSNGNQNGWNEYSRLVLAEIETLNNKVDAIVKENNAIKQELSKLEQFKDEISSLKDWKGNVDEVSSPTQLKELQKEVSDLKTFKTMSTTVWVVVQIIFGIAATLFGLYLKSN
jgi:predicted  nucleic acid-binding Zn-ribbon protein